MFMDWVQDFFTLPVIVLFVAFEGNARFLIIIIRGEVILCYCLPLNSVYFSLTLILSVYYLFLYISS